MVEIPLSVLKEVQAILKTDFKLGVPPWDSVGVALDEVTEVIDAYDKTHPQLAFTGYPPIHLGMF
jgi:hypothetical protein